jgi:hypothetical protein
MARESDTRDVVAIAESACAAIVSLNRTSIDRCNGNVSAVDQCRLKRVTRTLSRGFWQQKNFHAHRLRVSSSLAKTAYPRESLQMIRD